MIADALALFNCPACSGRLIEQDAPPGNAALSCTSCGAEYATVRGIPRFVPATNYAASFGLQWNRHRRSQLDSHTGLPVSRSRLFETTGWGENLTGERILEAGSGAGRFTEVLLTTGAQIYSFDFSSAVDANHANQGEHPNLVLFQGDMNRLPLVPGSFDKVFCLGVLQHTPDPGRSFLSLTRCLRPGGEIAIDVYAKRLTSMLSWKYALRPVTRRIPHDRLYRVVEGAVDALLPTSVFLRRAAGRVGARLLPIVEYSHLGLAPTVNRDWAVLDTFDMYAPEHDHPQTQATVSRWFAAAGLIDVVVKRGQNGIVARGRRPVGGAA